MTWTDYVRAADWNRASGICLGAYLLGCFTSGYYLVRIRTGQDIRDVGSGSVGAKNVGRVLGKAGFLFTLLFDFGKGAFAVWSAKHFTNNDHVVALAMLAVVCGHIWPAQLRFHGGKGMATSLGALMVFDPSLAFAYAGLFICLFMLLRKTVLPGLFALVGLPAVAIYFGQDPLRVVLLSILAGLVLFAHRKNLTEEFLQLAGRRNIHPDTDQS